MYIDLHCIGLLRTEICTRLVQGARLPISIMVLELQRRASANTQFHAVQQSKWGDILQAHVS